STERLAPGRREHFPRQHSKTAFDTFQQPLHMLDTLRHFSTAKRFGVKTAAALADVSTPSWYSGFVRKMYTFFGLDEARLLSEICTHLSDKTRCRIEARVSTSGGAFST